MADRRWAWAEVDLAAIGHNVRTLKASLPATTLFMAVVKADGYGHGAVQVAGAALAAGADRLGVATVDEGAELRKAGVTAPIHVLSEPPPGAAGLVVRNQLIPALYSRDFALALSKVASVAQVSAPFHLKVNTGMNRIGIAAEDAASFVESLRGLPGIAMEGVYTHFATADVPGDWEFERQAKCFDATVRELRAHRIDCGIVHSANSAATILHPETHGGMVRCGIALYGLHPGEATRGRVDLRPAMSVKARVSQVRRIAMGEGVSYGFTYHAGAPVTIATLPIGYADGVRRGLSDSLRVLVQGTECRQVGRICMDQLMVEIPRGLTVSMGDEAVLVGGQGSARIEIDEQATTLGTINYEMACGYGARLSRRYTGQQ
ncbi:MAG: alanine racemase [Coriobacteriia bacterium]|nr:alanine racemase [Coriobacteriia bacterium]